MSSALSKEVVLSQLSRILRSQCFRNSEMLRNFLSFVVREKLEGNESKIKQYSIAVNSFGRSPDFDATSDPIVRIQAGRLRQTLDTYYQQEGQEDEVKITLPKGSYVPEVTLRNQTSFKGSGVASSSAISHSIAIFPIRNLSENDRKQLMVDGFTEELLAELSRYRHLHVIRANEELNTATRNSLSRFALEGTLRFGESLGKISLTLTDNYTLEILWTKQKKFETEHIDIIGLQEEIGATVAQQIAGMSGVLSEKLYSESNWERRRNPSAYATYLHFYKYALDPSPENTERVMAKVTQAVESEPDFAPGWAVLARLCTDAYIFNLDSNMLEKALVCGKKAVSLQANNQSCQAYYAYALMVSDQFYEAKVHGRKALELNPNSVYYTGAIGFLYCMMDWQEAGRKLINRSISMDFRYPWWFHVGTYVYHLNRSEFNAALRETEKINTPHFWASLTKLTAHYQLGQEEIAVTHLHDLMDIKPDFFDNPEGYVKVLLKSEPARELILESLTRVIDITQALHS